MRSECISASGGWFCWILAGGRRSSRLLSFKGRQQPFDTRNQHPVSVHDISLTDIRMRMRSCPTSNLQSNEHRPIGHLGWQAVAPFFDIEAGCVVAGCSPWLAGWLFLRCLELGGFCDAHALDSKVLGAVRLADSLSYTSPN